MEQSLNLLKDIHSIGPGFATIALYLLGSWIQSARRLSWVLFTFPMLLQFGKIYICDFSKRMDCVCFNWRNKCLIAHKVHLWLVHTTPNSRLYGSNLVNIARFTSACGGLQPILDHLQSEGVYTFLMGLNENFLNVRGQILLMGPLPSINQVFALVFQDE